MTRVQREQRVQSLLRKEKRVTAGGLALALGVSRQAAHKHLRQMVKAGELVRQGAGRGAHYVSPSSLRWAFRFRRKGLTEEYVRGEIEDTVPFLRRLPRRARDIFEFALLEMVNNAIDHSGGTRVEVRVENREKSIAVEVADDGVGAFARLQRSLRLSKPELALLELTKGKVTSDPKRHTGQGIFFTSKAVGLFELEANGQRWLVDNRQHEEAMGHSSRVRGTRVRFELSLAPPTALKEVFDAYTHDFEFDVTRIRVKLFESGRRFLSRSEARRVMHGLERFQEVVLDFSGVELVGQGFADEVFRVWAAQHPGVRLEAERMNSTVKFFVDYASPPSSK